MHPSSFSTDHDCRVGGWRAAIRRFSREQHSLAPAARQLNDDLTISKVVYLLVMAQLGECFTQNDQSLRVVDRRWHVERPAVYDGPHDGT